MQYSKLIQETASNFGSDEQIARLLYSSLCKSNEPGAQFAAEIVRQIVELASEARNKMELLESLAEAAEAKEAAR